MKQERIIKNTKNNHLLGIILIYFISLNNSFAQLNNDSITTINFSCNEINLNFNLPFKCFKKIYNYDEGTFAVFSCLDSSVVIIYCGSRVNIPINISDNYLVTDSSYSINVKIRKGIKKNNNRFWREDNYKNITIIYDDMKMKNANILNGLFDHFQIK